MVQTEQRDPSLEIMQELHKASDQTDLTLPTTILSNHTNTVNIEDIGLTLPPRTKHLQNEINTCYDLFNTLLNDTITKAFNNITTNKSKRKLTHYNLQVKISDLYLTNIKTITRLLAINQGNSKKKRQRFKKAIIVFKDRHNHLNVLFNEQKDHCYKLIDNYTETASDICIHWQTQNHHSLTMQIRLSLWRLTQRQLHHQQKHLLQQQKSNLWNSNQQGPMAITNDKRRQSSPYKVHSRRFTCI